MRKRASLAFTLIEMLAVMLLASIVLTAVVTLHLNVSAQSAAALELGADLRRATSVLDRVTRDLEAATLVKKPAAVDPLEHPWLFLGEGRGLGEGADRLKFQARNHRPRAAAGRESDLVTIAYWLAPAEEGDGLELYRWTSPRLPESLDRSFPRRDDPGVERLASRVAAFGVRFQDDAGAWSDAWDSSTLARSGELPVAAEVTLALLPEQPEAEQLAAEPPAPFRRPVVLALRPLDLAKALGQDEAEGEGEEEDGEQEELACVTVRQCVARNKATVHRYLGANREASLEAILESIGDQCWRDHAASLPVQVSNCD
jgi:type II secretory pathway component PulJ